MWNTIYRATVGRVEGFDQRQLLLLVVVLVCVGVWCMKGFGSRNSY